MHELTSTDMATKTGVGIVGTGYAWMNMPLSTWVAVATFLYMLCQLIVILPRVIETLRTLFRIDKNGNL